jgi:hypothetical protein
MVPALGAHATFGLILEPTAQDVLADLGGSTFGMADVVHLAQARDERSLRRSAATAEAMPAAHRLTIVAASSGSGPIELDLGR